MFGRNRNNDFNNNRFHNRFNNNGLNNGSNKPKFFLITFGFIALVGVIIFAQHNGSLGHYKNRLIATPTEQKARINQGMGAVTQANKNCANEELAKHGDKDAGKNVINDPILLKDQIGYLPDMLNMGNGVYSIYFFANNKDYDKSWKKNIKKYRKQDQLKIYTFNGNSVSNNTDDKLNQFVYNYFNKNYEISKKSKKYGAPDGQPHPFMLLVVKDKPVKLIVNQKDQVKFLQYQYNVQTKLDKDANNFKLPEQPIGIPYPDYKKYFNEIKDKTQQVYQKGKQEYNNYKNGNSQSSQNNINDRNVNNIPDNDNGTTYQDNNKKEQNNNQNY